MQDHVLTFRMDAACMSAGPVQLRGTAAEAQACCISRVKQGESALPVSDTADVPPGISAYLRSSRPHYIDRTAPEPE
jgi:hypothetical protein